MLSWFSGNIWAQTTYYAVTSGDWHSQIWSTAPGGSPTYNPPIGANNNNFVINVNITVIHQPGTSSTVSGTVEVFGRLEVGGNRTLRVNNNVTIRGGGIIHSHNGILEVNTPGTLLIEDNAILEALTGGFVQGTAVTGCFGHINWLGGTFSTAGAKNLNTDGTMDWHTGTVSGGALNVNSGAVLVLKQTATDDPEQISGCGYSRILGTDININGVMNFEVGNLNEVSGTGNVRIKDGGVLNLSPVSGCDLTSGNVDYFLEATTGAIYKTESSAVTLHRLNAPASGVVQVNQGALNLSYSPNSTPDNAALYTVVPGATLTFLGTGGAGTLSGTTFTNGGIVNCGTTGTLPLNFSGTNLINSGTINSSGGLISGNVTNNGGAIMNTGADISFTGDVLTNNGVIQSNSATTTSGRWLFDKPGTQTLAGNGSMSGIRLNNALTLVNMTENHTIRYIRLSIGKLNIGNNTLTIPNVTTGVINPFNGGSETSYINMQNNGAVVLSLQGTVVGAIPVGNGSYTPISGINMGSTAENYTVKVYDHFSYSGYNDCGGLSPENVVNRMWEIKDNNPGNGAPTSAIFTLAWNQSDEGTNFAHFPSPSSARIVRYQPVVNWVNASTASSSSANTRTISPSITNFNDREIFAIADAEFANATTTIPTLGTVAQNIGTPVCENTAAQIDLTGLLPGLAQKIFYNINGGPTIEVVVTSNGSGNASFLTAALPLTLNGATLEITAITNLATTCTQNFSGKVATLTIYDTPVANAATLEVCSTAPGGSTGIFTLTDANTMVNAGNIVATTISYHVSQADADAGNAPLPSSYTNTTTPQTIYVRVQNAAASNCYATAVVLLKVNPTPAPGVVSGNRLICEMGDPSGFTSTTAASGGTGALTYQWQYFQDAPGTATWTNVSGATSTTYNIPGSGIPDVSGVGEITTLYRRKVTDTKGCSAEALPLTVYVNKIDLGSILSGGNQLICTGGVLQTIDATTPITIANPPAVTTVTTYQWQESASGTGSWVNTTIGGTGEDYTPPATLAATRYYRRIVSVTATVPGATPTSVSCSATPATWQALIAVNNITAGAISTAAANNQTICSGGDPAVFSASASVLPVYPAGAVRSYIWESSTDNGVTWAVISGSNVEDYNPPAGLTVSTWYRRVDYSALNGLTCSASASGIAKVTVNTVNAGTITPPATITICSGADPDLIIGSTVSNPNGATIAYAWQSSTNAGATWSTISGATQKDYNPPAITTTTQYRRRVTFTLNGVACLDYSNSVTFTVNPNPTAPTVSTPANANTSCTTSPVDFSFTITPNGGADKVEWTTDANFNGAPPANYGTGAAGTVTITLPLPAGATAPVTYNIRFRSLNSFTGCVSGNAGTAGITIRSVTIYPPAEANAGPDKVTCYNSPVLLGGSISGGASSATWTASVTGGTFSPNTSTLNASYTPSPTFNPSGGQITLTLTTNNPSGPCNAVSATMKLTVLPKIDPGSIAPSGSTVLCNGGNPDIINSVTEATTGASVLLGYRWENSLTAAPGSWSTIAGATSSTYDPPVLTQTTHYRRIAVASGYAQPPSDGSGECLVYSNTITFTVNQPPLVANQTVSLCSGQPSGLTLGGSSNGIPVSSYNVVSISANGLMPVAGNPVPATGITANELQDDAWRNNTAANAEIKYFMEAVSPEGCIGSFTVTLTIYPEPRIICPATNITQNTDPGVCSAAVQLTHPDNFQTSCTIASLSVGFSDGDTGSPDPVSFPLGGEVTPGSTATYTFAHGITLVTYTVTDVAGNTANCSYTITIKDVDSPQIICPTPDVSGYFADNGYCTATLSFAATATDNCGVSGYSYAVGGSSITFPYDFPVGSTAVTATATDVNGLASSCDFTVLVVDNQQPAITCPTPAASYNTDLDECNATLSFAATATDNCGVPGYSYTVGGSSIAFPYNFPVGSTAVIATATDVNGLTSSCSFTVSVTDTQNPAITSCPAAYTINGCNTDAISGLTYSSVSVSVSSAQFAGIGGVATDNCAISGITYQDTASGSCPITVTRTWTVTDNSNNTAVCVQTITIQDTTPPTITCPSNVTISCDQSTMPTVTGTASAIDNCSTATVTYSDAP
ncbi:HYR domain-containing protein, partial [Sphingobacteriales bacterium UPWRP_1]